METKENRIKELANDFSEYHLEMQMWHCNKKLERLKNTKDLDREFLLRTQTSLMVHLKDLEEAVQLRKSMEYRPMLKDPNAVTNAMERMPFYRMLNEQDWTNITERQRKRFKGILNYFDPKWNLDEFIAYSNGEIYRWENSYPNGTKHTILLMRAHILCRWFAGYDGTACINRANEDWNAGRSWRIND